MLLCHRNINQFRRALALSPCIQNHSKCIQYRSQNQFCSVTKLQNRYDVLNRDSIINEIKESNKSDQLSVYLKDMNLTKGGNKATKIERLLSHFDEHANKLNELNESQLRSFSDFFNLSVDNNTSKDMLISNLSSFMHHTQTSELEITDNIESETEERFAFQVDQERQEKILEKKEENELKLVQIDEKQSFLHKYPIDICSKVSYPNDSEIIFETSRIGHLSESAIIVNCKGTIVLTTATSKIKSELSFQDGLDLKVDAHERSWSRGYIPSGFQRSDGGITDYEILLCRMIDRAVRPLFTVEDNIAHKTVSPALEVQILSNLLSCDDVYDTQSLAINGASAALYCSPQLDISAGGAVGAVRVIMDKNGEMICNPSKAQIEDEETKCNLLYVGTRNKCVMIETNANIIDEASYCKLLQFAQTNVAQIVEAIEKLKTQNDAKNNNKQAKIINEDLMNKYETLSNIKVDVLKHDIVKQIEDKLCALYSDSSITKNDRNTQRDLFEKEMINKLCTNYFSDDLLLLSDNEWCAFSRSIYSEIDRKSFRNSYAVNNLRCDGRKMDELRSLSHMIDILPSCHGSALFERGNTQTLCSATLGPPRLARMRDMHQAGHPEIKQRLYFQYEMAPFATNEIKQIQSKNRRAIGHANIALNALAPMLPSFESFPYSVRVYSSITASDGSSSMASVCGGSLCLMDAGIPMRDAVAGISVGLMDDVLITDICGIEDHFGDMDFKIAGTRNGINSVQLDIKRASGIPLDIILKAVHESYGARLRILHSMSASIAQSKIDLKNFAPRVDVLHVAFRDLPRVIGSGGSTKQQIQLETGCDINIFWEEECVEITAPNSVALNRAKRVITDVIGSQCRIGDIVSSKIINIQSYGVMVQIEDGSEHLVHISQWIDSNHSNNNNSDEYFEGQDVDIMCIGFLGENRPNFSKKAAVWQQSDDPEDRARLRLMLDSLRPPARSRALQHSSSSGSVSVSNSSSSHSSEQRDRDIDNENTKGDDMKKREPLSIFSEYPQDIDDDEEVEEEDDDILDAYEDEIPLILPPKEAQTITDIKYKRQQREKTDINKSIKNLIENISLSPSSSSATAAAAAATEDVLDRNKSRFANLYKDIHKEAKEPEAEAAASVKWENLIDSIQSNEETKEKESEKDVEIKHWKSFTKDLMKSNGNKIEKDEKGDDLLTDLFGEKHKAEEEKEEKDSSVSSRAAALMGTIPELLNDDNDESQNTQEKDNKWPWQKL